MEFRNLQVMWADHWAIYRFGEMGDRATALSDATHQEELL
jgi:hypothetical protein